MAEDNYSEKIEFSEFGIRMAVIDDSGRVTHRDNYELEIFGGVLPAVGDYITTLWDPERPDPAESYLVIERQWIGELEGDNCWWLLLKETEPTLTQRHLFEVARQQSVATRGLSGATYADLVEVRKALEKKKQKTSKTKRRSS